MDYPVPDEEGAANTAVGTTIAVNDVHLTVPADWDSESFINPSGMLVLRLGSFEFRHASDDDVGQVAQASIGPADVLINIVDVTATDPGDEIAYYKPLTLPLTLDASQAIQQESYEVPAAVIRGVRISGRNLYVSVAFGSAPPSAPRVPCSDSWSWPLSSVQVKDWTNAVSTDRRHEPRRTASQEGYGGVGSHVEMWVSVEVVSCSARS